MAEGSKNGGREASEEAIAMIRDDGGSDRHKGKQRIKDDCQSSAWGSWVDAMVFTEIGKKLDLFPNK